MSIRTKGKIIAGTPRNGVDLLDFKWSDHILDDISWLRADTFSWQPGSVYVAVYEHLANEFDITKPIEAETFSGVTVYFRTSPDGHKIVLADGEQDVINMYNATGIAWYYILDTTNKRFKLPRTKFGFTGLRNKVGKYVAPGLPDHTHTSRMLLDQEGYGREIKKGMAYYKQSGGSGVIGYHNSDTSLTNRNIWAIGESGTPNQRSIFGASTTVQPPATQMYLYFYVGNSVRDEHVIDAGALAEAVNDFDVLAATDAVNETRDAAIVSVNATKDTSIQDIETARDNSVLRLESMGNALNHTNISNCVTKIPQDIKLEFNNGAAILKAGSKVYMPNGSGVFDIIVIPNDIKLSGWANLQGMVFVAFDGLNAYFTGNSQIQSGSSGTISGGNVWYDTTTNKIFRSSGSAWDTQVSFPICIVSCSDGNITSVDQVFNGFGYIGSTVFALPGVEGLAPNGRNEDGSLKTIKYTLPKVALLNGIYNATTSNLSFAITTSGSIAYSPLYTQDTNPNKTYALWFNPKENKAYTSSSTTDFTEAKFFVCGSFDRTAGTNAPTLSNFKTKLAFHAVDYSDFAAGDYVIKTYSSGTTWYRKYKSGWVEQGVAQRVTGGGSIGVTLPVPMADANYTILVSQNNSDGGGVYFQCQYHTPTATGFKVISQYGSSRTSRPFLWYVCGMAA